MPTPATSLESFSRNRSTATPALPRTPGARWLFWLTVLAMVVPFGILPTANGAPLAAHGLSPHAAPTAHVPRIASAHPPPADLRAIPGSYGPPGPALSPSTVSGFHVKLPASAHTASAAGASTRPSAQALGTAGILSLFRDRTAAPAVAPSIYQVPIGWFSGYVNDSSDRNGISGELLQVYSSALCSTNRCPPAYTTLTGYFNITCPAAGGPGSNDAIVLTTNNWYFDNVSYNTCIANTTVNVGTIFLVRDGVGIGFVKDPTTGKPIAGVQVSAITRDQTVQGYPIATTGINGSFVIGLPPVPAKVLVNPPAGYETTFNYTYATPGTGNRPNVPPWYGGVNLGTFYLVRQTLVVAHLYDSLSGGNITGSNAASALTACSAFGGCNTQGIGVTGLAHVTAFANPGWDYFEGFSSGHIMSTTAARLIPQEPPGTKFDIGRIDLAPLGQVNIKDALSAPTGGTPQWRAPNSGSGSVYAQICSDNGYLTSIVIPSGTYYSQTFNLTDNQCFLSPQCWNVGQTAGVPAPPLRSLVTVIPDTSGICNPFAGPQWPVNGNDPPTWTNWTYANVTAGHVLASPNPVWINFTVGDYIYGHVGIAGAAGVPSGYVVAESSTDNAFWNTESYTFNSLMPVFTPCSVSGAGSFCIGVPPGNSRITVSAPGYSSNWTWVHTPDYCCKVPTVGAGWPASLAQATANHVASINLTPLTGTVWGYTIVANTPGQPVPITTVSVCPAASQSTQPCGVGLGINGTFYGIAGPVGTDVVTATAPGYSPNSIWLNVTAGQNTSAGVIPLYPLAVLSGKVQGPNGTPIFLADIMYCAISTAVGCETGSGGQKLGPGVTTSDGRYNGTVPGGWLPWTTYVVVASAPGYTTDWAFANASVGNYTTLPTLTLKPIGTNTSSAPVSAGSVRPAANAPAAGVWINGRIYANDSGGVYIAPGTSLQFCPLASIVCDPVADGSNTEGYFNTSVTPGLYFLNITPSGYQPLSLFVNASAAGFIDLGMIYLLSDWWIAGRLVINPWQSVTLSTSGIYGHGYGPAASVQGCDLGRSNCEPAVPAATNGSFNAPIPVSPSATLVAAPSGAAFGGSVAGGFLTNTTSVHNLTQQNNTLSGAVGILPLDIFGVVSGRVWNNNTVNESVSGTTAAYGLPYASVNLYERGNNTGQVAYFTDGGGFWTEILPGGNGPNMTSAQVTDNPAYPNYDYVIQDPVVSGYAPASGGNTSLERFGWVQSTFYSTGTGLPVGDVAASASYNDPRTGTYYSDSDTANTAGFLNLSSPFGARIHVVTVTPDFNTTNFTVASVNSSATSYPNGTGVGNVGRYFLPAWGWVVANVVNYTDGQAPPLSTLPLPVVQDPVRGEGVPGASLTVSSTDPSIPNGGSQSTNWAGQFYSDAPIGPTDSVLVTREGFLTNATNHVVSSGSYTIFASINLTGEAVVAGLVTADPGGAAVSNAEVNACGTIKNQVVCNKAFTNVSGVFWVISPPGPLSITISALNFVSSVSYVTGCSDCWVYAGHVNLSSYGTVSGNVRGLPSGFPIQNANVSLCSPLGTPTGTCGPSVTSNQFGHFVISAPPGSYVLAVNDTNYNSTYLPVSLSPGEQTTVGTVFLSEFGSVSGQVISGDDFTPLAGATVIACPVWPGGNCAPAQSTDFTGRYSFSAAPGLYNLQVSLTGYVLSPSENPQTTVYAGLSTSASPVVMYTIGTDSGMLVTGRVLDNDTGATLGGVTIAAFNGNLAIASSTTLGNGSFALRVPYGTYELRATKDGYATATRPIVPGQPLTFVIRLMAMTYPVTGLVLDALTQQPVNGAVVSVDVNGAPSGFVASTDLSGAYVAYLTNGTHDLVVSGAPGSPVPYADTFFVVEVNGRAVAHDLVLSPGVSTLQLTVVDALTGLPIVGASVTVQGTLEQVYRVNQHFTTSGDGSIATPLYAGEYTASVVAGGYAGGKVTFSLNATGRTEVTVRMVASGGPSAASGPVTLQIELAAAGIAALAVVAGLLLAGRPRRAAPAPPLAPRAPPKAGNPGS